MSRDAKIGLVIVFAFAFLFGTILVHRLQSGRAASGDTADELAATKQPAVDEGDDSDDNSSPSRHDEPPTVDATEVAVTPLRSPRKIARNDEPSDTIIVGDEQPVTASSNRRPPAELNLTDDRSTPIRLTDANSSREPAAMIDSFVPDTPSDRAATAPEDDEATTERSPFDAAAKSKLNDTRDAAKSLGDRAKGAFSDRDDESTPERPAVDSGAPPRDAGGRGSLLDRVTERAASQLDRMQKGSPNEPSKPPAEPDRLTDRDTPKTDHASPPSELDASESTEPVVKAVTGRTPIKSPDRSSSITGDARPTIESVPDDNDRAAIDRGGERLDERDAERTTDRTPGDTEPDRVAMTDSGRHAASVGTGRGNSVDAGGSAAGNSGAPNDPASSTRSGAANSPASKAADSGSPRNDRPGSSRSAGAGSSSGEKPYTVKSGDSFWSISARQYGSGKHFRDLEEYNKDRVGPSGLKPGAVIAIPDVSLLQAKKSSGSETRISEPRGGASRGNSGAAIADAARFDGNTTRPPADSAFGRGEFAGSRQPADSDSSRSGSGRATTTLDTTRSNPGTRPSGGSTSSSGFDSSRPFGERTPPAAGGRTAAGTYIVLEGDTLSTISQRELGSAKRWKEILQLNRDKIPDENHLKLGVELRLPAASTERIADRPGGGR